jgi:multiple sugar transport system permease protein
MTMAVAVADFSRPAANRALQTKSVFTHLLIVVYFVVAIFPFFWIVGMSLKQPADVVADPPVVVFKPTLENYEAVLLGRRAERGEQARTDIPRAFRNSVIIALASVTVAMLVGNLGAFALAKLKLPAREWAAFFFLSFRFAPALAFIIPTFVVFRTVGLYNTHLGMTITFIGYEQVLWGQMAAAAVVTIVPELILAVLVMGYIVRGLTYGAVKE